MLLRAFGSSPEGSYGSAGNYLVETDEALAANGIEIGHFDMRNVKSLNTDMIDNVLKNYDQIITFEDGTILGGFGSAVAEFVAEKGAGVSVEIMDVPDIIVEHCMQRELHDEVGIGPDGNVGQVKRLLGALFFEGWWLSIFYSISLPHKIHYTETSVSHISKTGIVQKQQWQIYHGP